MGYQWPLDPAILFEERSAQMTGGGLDAADVAAVRSATVDMWRDGDGGWVREWSRLAERYVASGRLDLAALAYGWAKFPSLADDAKRTALRRQADVYAQMVATDPKIEFERRVLDVPFAGTTTPVPVHLLGAPGLAVDVPVILASGGVDTWKIDLHGTWAALAHLTGARVLAFDIPGTGETLVPLSPDSVEVVDGLVAAARGLGDGRVFHFGISMGGYFAAATGLKGTVDGAVVCGGPVEAAFAPDREWHAGMADIVGNAAGFDRSPAPTELSRRLRGMSLRPLLDQDTNAPMLVINGADDIHVPQDDTVVFTGRRDTQVTLIPDSGHCAASKFEEMAGNVIAWLNARIAESKGAVA
ncbi:alpha/beta hydrolase [Streptomyces sp. NPDC005435]|uniref:alpha/beta fold hydrolase n=1 Tax=Streptomyces sp. NPDC005435 TaxID=3154464 RepID=UPI0034542681